MIVYRTRTCNTSCNTITLTYTTITSFMFDGLGTCYGAVRARTTTTTTTYININMSTPTLIT